MAVGDAYVFPGFLTPVLTQLFFPKPPTTFLTCFCRGERRKYAGKKSRLNRLWRFVTSNFLYARCFVTGIILSSFFKTKIDKVKYMAGVSHLSFLGNYLSISRHLSLALHEKFDPNTECSLESLFINLFLTLVSPFAPLKVLC